MNALTTTLWQRNSVSTVATAQSCSDDYRAKAAECQQVADRWPDDLVKDQYEELARQWRALAVHAERQR